MTTFKVGDEVQLVRDFGPYKRRKKGVIADYNCGETHFVSFDNKPFLHVPKDAIRPHAPRIRPTKSDIAKLKQEIAIRNEAIDRLEETVGILNSEKVRLGELNASLKQRLEGSWNACQKKIDEAYHEQARAALSLHLWKAVAVIAGVAAVLSAVLAWQC